MTEKVLTIAVPAYNAEGTLRTCLDSLLNERVLPVLDIIVVNDGSQDGTGAIGREYAVRYPESIRVIEQANGGHGSAINRATALARGKYFRAVDADDWLVSENLAAFCAALEGTSADVVLTHYRTLHRNAARARESRTGGLALGREYELAAFLGRGRRVRACCRFHGITYRTAFYRECGIRLSEKVFYEDQEYATLLFMRARTVLPLDLFLYEYTTGETTQSVSDENRVRYIWQVERVLWQIWERYRAEGAMEAAAEGYCRYKLGHIVMNYYVTALLINGDRQGGREQARGLRQRLKERDLRLYRETRKAYVATLALHGLGIRWKMITAIQHTLVYRVLHALVA
jgi:glycosyltransferase involved in cell wall biosynthesis